MSATSFHNEFRERFVSRPASRRQALGSQADQCILQRGTETEESENFCRQADLKREKERRGGYLSHFFFIEKLGRGREKDWHYLSRLFPPGLRNRGFLCHESV